MKFFCRNFIIILILIFPLLTKAQNLENRKILDTIYSHSIPIVIYDNYSWEYLNQADKGGMYNLHNINFLDTFSVFKENWLNNTIKPYPRGIKIPDTLKIVLKDTLIPKNRLLAYKNLMSGFGRRSRVFHPGLDIKLKRGDHVYALFDGKVRYARWNKGGYGNFVMIRHFNGLETCYAHLSKLQVKENQFVKGGTIIGKAGSTGRAYGTHLHLEFRYKGYPFDPQKVANFENAYFKSDTILITNKSFTYKANLESKPKAEKYTGKTNLEYYKIKSGDTLSHVAVRFRTTVSKLCRINGLSKNSILRIGQIIKLK